MGLPVIKYFVASAIAIASSAAAQTPPSSYPTRPVKLILPFGAGSGTDIAARLIGEGEDHVDLGVLREALRVGQVDGAAAAVHAVGARPQAAAGAVMV